MNLSVGCLKVLCLLLLNVKEINGTITQGPSNTVAKNGEKVKLNCIADGVIVYWILSKNGDLTDEVIITELGCSAIKPAFADHYAVESLVRGTTCNLIVSNITMEQAGVYRCQEGLGNVWSSLTVTERSPTMTTHTTLNAVVENETVINSCSLNHSGSVSPAPTLRPYFYWTDSKGLNVNSSFDSTSWNTAVSQLTVTAGRQNITSYTCHVYMQLTPSINPNYANNIPVVNNTASSPTVEVLYAPSAPVVTSKPAVIAISGVSCGISVLTCNSTGNPAPNYRWFDSAENVILNDNNTLTLAEVNRNYKCEAYNTIRNMAYKQSTIHTASAGSCGSTSTVGMQCCVFPRKETTLVTVNGCDNGTLCDCSQGSSGIILTCNAKTFPNASYVWKGPNVEVTNSPIFDQVTMNGVYRCTAYFDKTLSNYTGDVKFPNGTNETTVEKCYMNPADATDLIRTIILACVLGGYGLLNLIATIAFIVYYNRKSNTVNSRKQAFTLRNKMTLNARFPWLQGMLPCVNESEGNAGCTCMWVLLFILMSIFAGIIVFPILVAMANCSRQNNDARDDPDIGMSNVYQEDTIDRNGTATKSGTDAHGHVEAPYDEIGTMHPGRKVVLEEPTSSNKKDAKKVFYTKVNPNFNTEEGVERYSVSS